MPAEPPIVAAVFAWLHLLAIGVGAGMLLTEYWLCRRMPDRIQVRLLGQVDMCYQLALIGSLERKSDDPLLRPAPQAIDLAVLKLISEDPAIASKRGISCKRRTRSARPPRNSVRR